jgi:tetratricopeptide (TPR) repeat protein
MNDGARPMTQPAIDRDAACVQRLQQIEQLLNTGRAADALAQASEMFSDERTPAWRIADLCRLAATAAQTVGVLPLAEEMWRQAAAHSRATFEDASEGHKQAADAHANLGVLSAGQERSAEAIACFRRAIELDPDHVPALANLAVLLSAIKGSMLPGSERAIEIESMYRAALRLDPKNLVALTNLGLLLHESKRLTEAEECLRRALVLAPESAAIHSNLGNVLAQSGRETEAESMLRLALALDPTWAAAHCNIGVLLADQGRDAEAESHFRRAIELRPAYPLAQLDLSCLLLAQGHFEEGWKLHEARHHPALPDNGIPPPNIDLPRWRGEPLAGKSILVWPEQGLGDQIMFCRFVSQLKEMGAARIALVCQRPLLDLFRTLPGADAVLAADVVDNAFHLDPELIAGHAFWTFPLSLPGLLRTDLSTLPHAPLPYLHAPADRNAAWRDRLNALDGNLKVGLVWRGNPLHNNDAERSLPSLQVLAPLWSVSNVRFVSLQTGNAGAQAAESEQPLLHVGDRLHDFAETAAALDALDLLICVDTSIAHLAGAMAKDCWVLLPQRKTDWRWLRDRDDSPWYASNMRLFRQTTRGDWKAVIAQVRDALAQRVSGRPSDGSTSRAASDRAAS